MRINSIKQAFIVLIAVYLSACSNVQFSADGSLGLKTGNPVNSCRDVLLTTNQNLRVMFMVDNSGSTKTTDRDKYYRVQTLQNFLQVYGSKSNLTYSYGMFSNSFSLYESNNMSPDYNKFVNHVTSFGSAGDLSNAVNLYRTGFISDGTTNYKQAFGAIQSNILSDLSLGSNSKAYSVVFMSDGQPKDLPEPINDSISNLVGGVITTVQAAGGSIRISGVYFGPDADLDSKENIKSVALAGHGQYVDTNLLPNNALEIADTISIPGQNCGE